MRGEKSFLLAVLCLVLGFLATISLAQEASDEFITGEVGAGAKLVVTSVSGPTTAIHNQTISVTYNVKNQGAVASGSYKVGLYLSADKTIDPTADRLLKTITFSTGLAPGVSRKTTSKVLVPMYGLSGNYYYGAIAATSKKASSKQVSLARYSLGDNNETVTDHKTRLIWQQADDGKTRDWASAKKYCADLVLGGKTNWRLPRIDELETIVDYSRSYSSIDPVFDSRSYNYWSSSTLVGYPVFAWGVDFANGYAGPPYKTYDDYVRCVRVGPLWPFDPLTHLQTTSEKPGTVLDTFWGYVWQKGDSGDTELNWVQANAYCDNLELDGYSDWRLPEIEALQTIVDYTHYNPTLSTIFDPRRSSNYWSSSTQVYDQDGAFLVYFYVGYVGAGNKTNNNYVRCVRGGPGISTPTNTVPGAPTGVAATAGNAQATVSFTAPSNGGSPITSYTVTSSPGGKTATGESSPITVQGLTNGTAYTFTVTASNAIGTGPSSSPSNIVTPIAPGTRYVNNGDGTVTDTKIGLVWQKSDDGVGRSWDQADWYCSNLVLGGHDDWRLPRIDELETIVDYSRLNPSIDPVFDSLTDHYWSSSTYVTLPEELAWDVDFYNGYVDVDFETDGNFVRCVRGGPYWPLDPSPHLQTPSEKPGTVLDTYWGYMWQKGDSGATPNWLQAKAYCDNLELDGYSDWRLPEIEALQTIVDYTHLYPALSTIFNPRRSGVYWSSSTHVNYPDDAWYVRFADGGVAAHEKSDPHYVRCVRAGP